MAKNSDLSRNTRNIPPGKRLILLLAPLLLFAFITCEETTDQQFTSITERFFETYFQLHPIDATWAGIHEYDHLLDDLDQQSRRTERTLYHSTLKRLADVNPEHLTGQNRVDYRILRNSLRHQLFRLDTLREYTWNPMMYIHDAGNAVITLAMQSQTPPENSLPQLTARLRGIASWLNQAYQSLQTTTVVHGEYAVQQARDLAAFFRQDRLFAYFDTLTTESADEIHRAAESAAQGLENYAARIENNLLPRSERTFRLGPDLYWKELQYIMGPGWTSEAIDSRAEASVTELQNQMYDIADTLAYNWWNIRYSNPSRQHKLRVIRMVMDRISDNYPPASETHSYLSSQINQLRDFVSQHKIINQTPVWTFRILPTSPHHLQTSFTSLQQLGPLNAEDITVLYVKPIPARWSSQQTESYLREFNRFAQQLVLIRDVLPGIATFRYYSNRYPSLVRNMFSNTPVRQGWGAYCERLMLEEGWGLNNPRIRLMQLKREIQTAIDALIDQRVHTQNLSRSEAITLMTEQGFRTTSAAAERWRFLQLTPCESVATFVGKENLWDLRRKYARNAGSDFSLLDFHKRVLEYGAIPISALRQLLLENTL